MKKAKRQVVVPVAERPKPNDCETALIAASVERTRARRAPVKVQFNLNDETLTDIGPPHNDGQGWLARLEDAFGTSSFEFGVTQINALMSGLRKSDGKVDPVALNAALAVVDGVRPSNEIEAMLASQMAITHSLAMELLGRARRVDQIPQTDCAGNLAVKLLRTYTAQVEALAKLRRGGEQKVRVEHVHVYPGGQAIVGSVTAAGNGGGVKDENGKRAQAANDE